MPVAGEWPERVIVIQLVVVPVLQRTVSVDARLVREGVAPRARLVLRQRLAEGVTRPQREPARPRQVKPVADRGPVGDAESVLEGEDDREQIGIPRAFAD